MLAQWQTGDVFAGLQKWSDLLSVGLNAGSAEVFLDGFLFDEHFGGSNIAIHEVGLVNHYFILE